MPDATQPLAPAESPLVEADANSINELIAQRVNELFNKPPLSVSDDELMIMVAYYRKERARFIIESQNKPPKAARAAAGTGPVKTKPVPTSVAQVLADLKAAEDLF